MSTNREGHSAISARSRGARCLGLLVAAVLACGSWSSAQSSAEFHKTLALNQSQPLLLTIEIASANLEVVYGRDGEVSISAVATSSSNSSVDDQFFTKSLTLEQDGNRVSLRAALSPADSGMNIRYRLDVPYRTEVSSRLTHGTQLITGMLGPVNATAGKGDIKVSYVSKGVRALAETGDIDFQVIGERGEARTGAGNISCSRAVEGINAGTGEGDITLMVVGPSIAIIGKGTGRIDIGGARGSLTATTPGKK